MSMRNLRRLMKVGTLAHSVPEAVVLHGGPMDGWVVKPDAAALREDWWETWIPIIAERWVPGRYVRKGRQARWLSDPGPVA